MIRLSLLLSATLLFAAPLAVAQTYETGSQPFGEPRSSAQFGDTDGADFTTLSPAQIAADVTARFNPRTGDKEWVAPTFDPFEDDDRLAGTVNLRSTAGARNLNGDPVTNGALLDISLYYTDTGDRRFGLTRDALFLNGDPVPTILRDSRELECSSRVTERVYRYDDRIAARNIWMRPHYRGHRGFSYGGFGARWGGYGTARPRSRNHRRPHPRDDVKRPRRRDPGTPPRVDRDRQTATPTPYYPHSEPRLGGGGVIRPRPREATPRTSRPRSTGARSNRREDNHRTTDPSLTIIAPDLRQPPSRGQRRDGAARTETRTEARPAVRPAPRARRVEPRAEPAPALRADPRPRPRVERRPAPTPRPTPAPAQTPRPRVVPTPRAVPTPRQPRSSASERTRVVHDMFPGDGYEDAVVVRSERDCAREDQLSVFIPKDRLEAARFDGLTLILRDVTFDPKTGQTTVYDERPLYIPPNYIAGFGLALPKP